MIKSFLTYAKERFPIIPAMLFSVLFGFSGIAYISVFSHNFAKIFIVTLMMFLFLLRIRLWDELKDFQYDSHHHGLRPIQKGIISLSTIKKIALFVLLIEITLQFFLSLQALVIFIVAAIYSYFMFRNFYVEDFENKSLLLCLLSHQAIFLIYIYYILSVSSSQFFLPKSFSDIWIVFALFIPPLIYEIGRKVKHRISPKGYKTNDTYIYRWGENKSYAFLFSLYYLQALSTFMISNKLDFLIALQLCAAISITLFYFTNRKMIIGTSDKWSIALGMYGLIVLNVYML